MHHNSLSRFQMSMWIPLVFRTFLEPENKRKERIFSPNTKMRHALCISSPIFYALCFNPSCFGHEIFHATHQCIWLINLVTFIVGKIYLINIHHTNKIRNLHTLVIVWSFCIKNLFRDRIPVRLTAWNVIKTKLIRYFRPIVAMTKEV